MFTQTPVEAYKIPAKKILADLPDLCEHVDAFDAVVKGAIVEKMAALYAKSAEKDITLVMEPKKQTFVDRDFKKAP